MIVQLPSYRLHAATGQARVTIRGKTFYLGKYGTPESRHRYSTLMQEHLSNTGRFAPPTPNNAAVVLAPAVTTINEVALAYLKHAKTYYQTNPVEVEKIKLYFTRSIMARFQTSGTLG